MLYSLSLKEPLKQVLIAPCARLIKIYQVKYQAHGKNPVKVVETNKIDFYIRIKTEKHK